jgi:hypothetical protein
LQHLIIPGQCVWRIKQVRSPKDNSGDLSIEHHCREGALANEAGEAATQEIAAWLAPAPCEAAVTV